MIVDLWLCLLLSGLVVEGSLGELDRLAIEAAALGRSFTSVLSACS